MLYILIITIVVIFLSLVILGLYNNHNKNSSTDKSLFGSNCPNFNPPTCTYGGAVTFVFKCYTSTNDNCYSGRQLSSPMSIYPGQGNKKTYYQYYIISITDSSGNHYNMQGEDQKDLNISFYQDNSLSPDQQLVGTFSNNQYSPNLAENQYFYFCGNQNYYVGVNSGDNANISGTTFYVCVGLVANPTNYANGQYPMPDC